MASRQLRVFERLCYALSLVTLKLESLDVAAQIYVELSIKGQIIGDADILIAASAIVEGLVVVTRNLRHYTRVPNLRVTSWDEVAAGNDSR